MKVFFLLSLASFAAEMPSVFKDAGITEKLGQSVSIRELSFNDETGKRVQLSDYFGAGRPVVLNLVYYGCPNLCTFTLNGIKDVLSETAWTAGKEFEVVSVSIDPKEKPELAREKKDSYMAALGKAEAAKGWHFLTGEETQIKRLASEVGFGYRWVEAEKQFAHSAGLFVLTPDGKISRILYGIQYAKQDFRLALLEAASGKIGTIVDRLLLFCYRYDATTRKYSLALTRVMQVACGGTVAGMGLFFGGFWVRQRPRKRNRG